MKEPSGGYDGPPETERPDFPDRTITYDCEIVRLIHGGSVNVVVSRSGEPWFTFSCDDTEEAQWISKQISGQRTILSDSDPD